MIIGHSTYLLFICLYSAVLRDGGVFIGKGLKLLENATLFEHLFKICGLNHMPKKLSYLQVGLYEIDELKWCS
jgi:hypothetical protein